MADQGTTAPAAEAAAPDAAPADAAPPSLSEFEAELAAAAAPDAAPPAEAAPPAPARAPAAPAAAEPAPTDAEKRARAILASATKKEAEALAKVTASRTDLLNLAKTSPQKFLAEAGMTVDQFLRAIQAEGEPPVEPKPEERISALEQRLADAKRAEETKAAAAETARLTSEIHAEVKAAADKYPRIMAVGERALSEVTDLMIAYFERHCLDAQGNVLPDAKPLDRHVAAAEVEAYYASLAQKLSPAPKPASNGTPTSQRQGSPTLATLSPREVAPTDDGLPMDEGDRFAAVIREVAQLQ